MRVKIGSKIGSNQRIDVHTLFSLMKCDHKILVIQFHSALGQDSMLTPEWRKNLVKIPESLLNQKVKWNHQHEVQDHFQAQVQFQEKDNLPECPGDFHNLEFSQVQMCVLKLNLSFENNMMLGSNQ